MELKTLLIEASKTIDFKFPMPTSERSTQTDPQPARADLSCRCGSEQAGEGGKTADCSGNGRRRNFDASQIQRKNETIFYWLVGGCYGLCSWPAAFTMYCKRKGECCTGEGRPSAERQREGQRMAEEKEAS